MLLVRKDLTVHHIDKHSFQCSCSECFHLSCRCNDPKPVEISEASAWGCKHWFVLSNCILPTLPAPFCAYNTLVTILSKWTDGNEGKKNREAPSLWCLCVSNKEHTYPTLPRSRSYSEGLVADSSATSGPQLCVPGPRTVFEFCTEIL